MRKPNPLETLILVFIVIFVRLIGAMLYWLSPSPKSTHAVVASADTTTTPLLTTIYDEIFAARIAHPDIVLAQCILESAGGSSPLATAANNLFGMRVAGQRPTTAIGTYKGHAKYATIHDAVLDYAIWQAAYCRNLSREAYFAYLDANYSGTPNYSEHLRKIIAQYKL